MFCGTPADWPGIWRATGHIPDPNMVPVGLTVTISCSSAGAPAPRRVQTASWTRGSSSGGGAYGHPYYCGDGDGDGYDVTCASIGRGGDPGNPGYQSPVRRVYSGARATRSYSGSYSGGGGMQSCIIARESGGNSQVMNSSGHYGLYQFSEQTWVAHGGSAGSFGHASVAEQNQVYYNTVAQDGYSDWAPYDGC